MRAVRMIGFTMLAMSCLTGAAWAARIPPVPEAGIVEPGDLIAVTVYDLVMPAEPAVFEVRVDYDGLASVPLIEQIRLTGQTTDRAAAMIAKSYADARLVETPIVTVGILEKADQATVQPGAIGSGDKLRITMYELTGPGRQTSILAQVAENGTIELPLAGQLRVAGMTEAQIDREIARLFRDRSIIRQAIVSTLRTAVADPPAGVVEEDD